MDKILSNHDKSDYSLNARSFDGIDVFSPMVNKEGNGIIILTLFKD